MGRKLMIQREEIAGHLTHLYIFIYVCIEVCMCVCACVYKNVHRSHISSITMQSLGYHSSSVRLCDRKLDMMIHSYSSRNWDIEARVLKVIGQPVLCREIYNKIKIKSVNISTISSAWHSKACLHFSSLLVLPSPSSTIKLLHSPHTSHLGLLSL